MTERAPGLIPGGTPTSLVLGQLIAAGLTLLSAPLVARAIGPEGRGLTATAIALIVLLPVVIGAGLPLEVRRRVASKRSTSAVARARLLVVFSFPLAVGAALIFTPLVFGSAEPQAQLTIFVGICLTPLAVSWSIDVGALVAYQRYRDIFVLRIIGPFVYVVTILLIWLATGTLEVWEVVAANVAGTFVAFLLSSVMVRPRFSGGPSLAELTRASTRFSGTSIVDGLQLQAPQIASLSILGAHGAGIYSVAATIGAAPLAFAHGLSAAFFSKVASSDGERQRQLVAEAVRLAITLAVMCAVGVATLAALVPLIFGPPFVEAVPVTLAFAVITFGLIVNYTMLMNYAAQGRGWFITAAQCAGFLLGLACFCVGGYLGGPVWATLGLSAGFLTTSLVCLSQLGIPVRDWTPRISDVSALIRKLLGRGSP